MHQAMGISCRFEGSLPTIRDEVYPSTPCNKRFCPMQGVALSHGGTGMKWPLISKYQIPWYQSGDHSMQ